MAEKNTKTEIPETKDNAINADPDSEENDTNAELPTEDEHEPAAVNKLPTEDEQDSVPTDTDSRTRQNLLSLPPAHKTAEEREARLKEEAMAYKREQTSSLSATTKQMNSVLKLMNNTDNLHLVKTGIDTFEMHYARYHTAYDQHTLRLGLDDRMKEENPYVKNNMTFLGFRTNVANWISNAEGQLTSHIDSASSKSGSKLTRSSKSRSSKSRLSRSTRFSSSSAKSELLAEQLRLAEMKAEMGFIELKHQAKQGEEKIELELQIAKSEARAAVMKKFVEEEFEEVDATRDLDKKSSEPQDLNRMLIASHLDPQAASFVPEPMIQHSLVTRSVPVPEMNSTQMQQKASAHKPETATVHVPSIIPVHEQMNTTAHVQERTLLCIPESVSSSHQTPVHIPESSPIISRPITVNEESMTTRQIPGLGASSYGTQVPTPLPPSNQESMMLQLLETQTQMRLPTPQVPKFSGDPLEYASFIMAFEARILPYVTTEANKLYYLDQQLEGCAKELIQGCIFMDANRGYTEARHLLYMEYGDPFKVATAYIEKANNWPNLKADDGQGLRTLSHFLTKCTNAMQNVTHMNVLNHLTNMQTIVLKLPLYLQNKWWDTVGQLRNRSLDRTVTFHDLAQFVKTEASSVNDPVFSKEALGQRKPKPNASVFATNVPRNAIQCYMCKQDHDIEQCKEFLAMTLSARRMYLQQNRRCFACFGHNHLSKDCRKKRQCKTCGRKHPTSLHDPNFGRFINNTQESATSSESNAADITVETSSSAMVQSEDSSSIVLQPIVPVKVRQAGSNRVTDTYALLDNGSTGCFITEDLRDQLKAKHEDSMLKLQTLHGIKHVPTSIVQNLEVSGLHDRNTVKLPKCYTRQEIPVDHSQIPKRELFEHFPHLAEVAKEIPPYFQHLGIGLLIGANCSEALQPLQVIPVNGDSPYAVLHKHGWTVNGQVNISYKAMEELAVTESCLRK